MRFSGALPYGSALFIDHNTPCKLREIYTVCLNHKGGNFMKNHQLQPNEVVRFQSPITIQTEKGDVPAELILTNLNFIFVTERKKFLWFFQYLLFSL